MSTIARQNEPIIYFKTQDFPQGLPPTTSISVHLRFESPIDPLQKHLISRDQQGSPGFMRLTNSRILTTGEVPLFLPERSQGVLTSILLQVGKNTRTLVQNVSVDLGSRNTVCFSRSGPNQTLSATIQGQQ